MQAVINRWGNSIGIRIPIAAVKKLNLKENMTLDVKIEKDSIRLKKHSNPLEALCANITEENLNIDDSFDVKRGKEW